MQVVYTVQPDKYAGLRSFLGGTLQGMENNYQRNITNQDIQSLLRYMQMGQYPQMVQNGNPANPQVSSMLGGNGAFQMPESFAPQQPQPQQFPFMKSALGANLAANYLQNQMMSPLQQAETNYYNQRASGAISGLGGRSLPAEWPYMTDEQRAEYIARYARGGREYGVQPWENQVIGSTPDANQKIQDSAEIKAGLKPKVENPSSTERTKLAEAETSKSALYNLSNLYKDEYVGFGKEQMTKAGGYIGTTTQEQENFYAASIALKNAVIRQITGAQMSEPEARRIMEQIPSLNDPPARWKAKRDQTLKNIEMLEKAQIQQMQKGGVYTERYNAETETSQIITATNPTTGQKIQSSDGGKTWQAAQ